MTRNRTPRHRADKGRVHRAGEGARGGQLAGSEEAGSRPSRSGATARDCSQPDTRGPPLRVIIYPLHGPEEGVDVTNALVDTIAMILWKLQGGNDPVNRLEARMLLERAFADGHGTQDTRSTPGLGESLLERAFASGRGTQDTRSTPGLGESPVRKV
jgi:hypothetical protein